MTGQEIITMFEGLIDDTLDADLELQLLNNAKDKIEGERDWEFLKKLDSSKSATSSAIDLPTDYVRTLNIFVDTTRYHQIPMEQKPVFVNSALRWYLDSANNHFYLLGSNPTGTVNHYYIYQTPDITTGTSPVWPAKFHKLLAFEMAELYFAIDQGERGFSWDDKFAVQKELLRRSMIGWDAQLQRRANENCMPQDYEAEYDLGSM